MIQDALWMTVDIGKGKSCHVGYRSCFYRSIPKEKYKIMKRLNVKFKEKEKKNLILKKFIKVNQIPLNCKIKINGP